MLERIKQIMKVQGLLSSAFADKIGVSRGTISHILTERNEPRQETVNKILAAFPDLSRSWLQWGEGQMYNQEKISILKQVSSSSHSEPDLFAEKNAVESSAKPQVSEYPQKNEVKKPENKTVSPAIQEVNMSSSFSKKIDKIMIFFNDKTFLTFIPEE